MAASGTVTVSRSLPLTVTRTSRPGAEFPGRVVEIGAHLERAAIGIDGRIDGAKPWRRNSRPAGRRRVTAICWPTVSRTSSSSGTLKLTLSRSILSRWTSGLPGIDIGADRDLAEAERAGEWRPDDELVELDFGELHGGAHQLEFGERRIEGALRDIARFSQFFVALEIGFREHQPGACLVIDGADQVIVEFEQDGAGLDGLAVLEQDLLDPPGGFRGDVDRFFREAACRWR